MIGAIIGAGVSLAGSLIGGAKAASEQRKANEALEKSHNETMSALRRRANEDGLQTAQAQSALTKARQMFDENVSRTQGTQAVMGGTDASVAQAKKQANDAMADVASNIAVNAEKRADAANDAMIEENKSYAAQKAGIHAASAQANTQAANQAMQAGIGLATADLSSKLETGKGLFGDGGAKSITDKSTDFGNKTFELVKNGGQLRMNYNPEGLYGKYFK